jgi:hypothetical protein
MSVMSCFGLRVDAWNLRGRVPDLGGEMPYELGETV